MKAAFFFLLLLGFSTPFEASSKQPFTVRDIIEHERFDWNDLSKLSVAPDGKHFFVVIASADIARDLNHAEVRVYSTDDVTRFVNDAATSAPPPRASVRFSSSSPRKAVENARWESDGRHISLLAEKPGGTPQVHRIDIQTGKSTQVTNEPTGVWGFGANADAFLYAVRIAPAKPPEEDANAPFVVSEREGLRDLLQLRKPGNVSDLERHRLFVVTAGAERREVEWPDRHHIRDWIKFWMAPDGKTAVALYPVPRVPAEWAPNISSSMQRHLAKTAEQGEVHYWVMQYVIVDMATGKVRKFIDSPFGSVASSFQFPDAIWTRDSKRFFIGNALLPASPADASDPERGLKPGIFEVEASTGKWTFVGHAPPANERPVKSYAIHRMQWDDATQTIRVPRPTRDGALDTLVFAKAADGWKASTESAGLRPTHAALADHLTLTIRESVSEPPVLRAQDARTGRERIVLEPLAALRAAKTVAAVREYEWRDKNGDSWKGALYTPPDYKSGERRPLVLQTHGYARSRYQVEGNGPTAFAAQALASRGMFVLQMQDKVELQTRPGEIATYLGGYEGAIAALVRDGLVDPKRVGAIGFSRTCFHVRNALAFTDLLAAALVSDGVEYGYVEYLNAHNIIPGRNRAEHEIGTLPIFDGKQPFGEGLQVWVERSPTFNLHKVKAPVRIEGIGRDSVLLNWEWYVGLTYLDKPVELHVIPNDEHELRRPRSRQASLGGSVDWFDFWLNGREDTDPAKAEQYQRWRKLKALQEKSRAAPG